MITTDRRESGPNSAPHLAERQGPSVPPRDGFLAAAWLPAACRHGSEAAGSAPVGSGGPGVGSAEMERV